LFADNNLCTASAFDAQQHTARTSESVGLRQNFGGNHRSAELCRKILAQHVLVYGLAQEVSLAGTRADAVEVDPEPNPDDPEGLNVLVRMRADRAGADGARTTG
jgi:hypothetical protein